MRIQRSNESKTQRLPDSVDQSNCREGTPINDLAKSNYSVNECQNGVVKGDYAEMLTLNPELYALNATSTCSAEVE